MVYAYIERIKEVNRILNAVVDNRYQLAIKEAKICDEQLATGKFNAETLEKEKPLYGVPITIKECCAVKGNRNSSYFRSGISRSLCKKNAPDRGIFFSSRATLYRKNCSIISKCMDSGPRTVNGGKIAISLSIRFPSSIIPDRMCALHVSHINMGRLICASLICSNIFIFDMTSFFCTR